MKTKLLVLILAIVLIASAIFYFNSEENSKIRTELYFGLSDTNGPIPYKAWNDFKSNTCDKLLDGYTLINAEGYWKSSNTKYYEKCVILIYIHDDSAAEDKKIELIRDSFKKQFKQESVLRTDEPVKASF